MGAHRRGTGSHSSPHRKALQSPRPRRQPGRQVLWPEGGHCGGDKGSLLQDLCLGAWGQVEAGGERSFTPQPLPGTGAQQALGYCHGPANTSSTHSPAQEQIQTHLTPKPCSVPLWGHGMTWRGQPSTLPGSGTGGWSISPGVDGKAVPSRF